MHNPENGWPLVQLETAAQRPLAGAAGRRLALRLARLRDVLTAAAGCVSDDRRRAAVRDVLLPQQQPGARRDDDRSDARRGVNATNTQKGPDGKGSHGYDWLDWAANVNVANHEIQFSKGGWLPGQGTSYVGTTGGLFYVLAQNGNSRQDVTTK